MAQKKANEGEMCDESKKILNDPYVVCKITRAKNANTVIYRARMSKDDPYKLDTKNPLEVFWLKIEPSYVKANRAKGKIDDRTELTYLESTLAYGVTATKIEDIKDNNNNNNNNDSNNEAKVNNEDNNDNNDGKDNNDDVKPKKVGKDQFKVVFVALKSKPGTLRVDPKDGIPKIFGYVNNEECVLTEIYVASRERAFGLLATVDYVELKGYQVKDKKKLTEKINP